MQNKHCSTQQCYDSAQMLCDHESYLATQYYLDQARMFFSRFQPDHERNVNMGPGESMIEFDRRDYKVADLCKPEFLTTRKTQLPAMRDEIYLQACPRATFNNNLKCSANECCSRTHQLFGNHTRAGTGHHQ